jgi:EmrB/QacA subfamily drug resistance transporter
MDVTVVGTALPRVAGQLGGLELYPWVFSLYLLASTVTVPIWGKLADLAGRRPAFLGGISLFLVGSLACGAAPSMGWLVAARLLQGLGAGSIMPLTMTVFCDIFPVETRARMQGIFSLVWGVSSVIGPMVGGLIVSLWSWRWVFYVNLPVGAAAMIVFAGAFHEKVSRREQRLDLAGAALLTSAVTLFLVAVTRPLAQGLGLTALAGALLAGFVAVERRAAEPLMPLDMLRDRVLQVASAAGFLTGPMLFGFVAYLPLYLQGGLAMSPVWAGILIAPVALAWSAGAFIGGRLILRSGFRGVVRLGAATLVAAELLLWLALRTLPSNAGWVAFALGAIALGAGMGLMLSAFVIAVQDRVSWERRGVATAILTLLRSLGATAGVAALGAILTLDLGRRLSGVEGAPSPSLLLDPHRLEAIPEAALFASRGALAASVTALFAWTGAIAIVCLVVTGWFPDVRPSSAGPGR